MRDIDTFAGLGAVVAVQAVIVGIVIVKYWDDILDVFVRERGHLPYGEDGTTNNSKPDEKIMKKLRDIDVR